MESKCFCPDYARLAHWAGIPQLWLLSLVGLIPIREMTKFPPRMPSITAASDAAPGTAAPAARHVWPRASTLSPSPQRPTWVRGAPQPGRISSEAPVGGRAWLASSSLVGPRGRRLPAHRASGKCARIWRPVSRTPQRQPHSIRGPGGPRLAIGFLPRRSPPSGTAGRFGYMVRCARIWHPVSSAPQPKPPHPRPFGGAR